MSTTDEAVIIQFYQAFQRLDAEAMMACYTDNVVFSDPAFGTLLGSDAADMWRMLTGRAKGLSLTFDQVQAANGKGAAHWVATYPFTQTGRTVVNSVRARFVLRDGRICEHHDHFDLWRWARQALGMPGLLLGWSPLLKNKVRRQALKALRAYQAGRVGQP